MKTVEINHKIIKIWEDYKEDNKKTKLWPLLLPELEENSILFISINPGFPKNDYWEKNLFKREDFLFSNKNLDKNKEIQREKEARNPNNKNAYYKPYFKPMLEIMKFDLLQSMKWEHLDLFFIRETNSKHVEKMVGYSEKIEKMNDFGEKQLEISLSLIKKLKPKIIVVSNALASRIIRKRVKIDESSFKENGFDLLCLENVKVPIFFSGMLSGQRALDLGSLRRLKWHIGKALQYVGGK
jgi:hypothetical protein